MPVFQLRIVFYQGIITFELTGVANYTLQGINIFNNY